MRYIQGGNKESCLRKRLIVTIFVFGVSLSFLFADDLLNVKTARILRANRILISYDVHRYSHVKRHIVNYYTNYFSVALSNDVVELLASETNRQTSYEILYMPITLQYGMANVLEVFATVPFVSFKDSAIARIEDATQEEIFPVSGLGDVTFGTRIRFERMNTLFGRTLYSYFNLALSFQIKTSQSASYKEEMLPSVIFYDVTNEEIGGYDTSQLGEPSASVYPFSRGKEEVVLSFHYTQEWTENILTHVNVGYVYEFFEGESFMDGLTDEFIETKTEGGETEVILHFFGIDKFLKRYLWTWSRTDPWFYRRNDSLKGGIAVEYFFDSPLTFGKAFDLDLSYKVFFEVSGTLHWDTTSSERSELLFTPGVWVRVGRIARFMFGYSFVLRDTPDRFYTHRFGVSMRIMPF